MIIEKIGAEYKRKFNLGNFESAEIGAIIWASTDRGDDVGECYDTLFSIAKETVKINVPPSYKNNTPSYSESFTKLGQKVSKEFIGQALDKEEYLDLVQEHQYD